MSLATDIEKLHLAYFNRPAEPNALQYWESQAQIGSITQVVNAFGATAEYRSAIAGLSNTQIIDTLYVNLFGRHAEATGLAFWEPLLDSGALRLVDIPNIIVNSAQNDDLITVNNKANAALQYTLKYDSFNLPIYDAPYKPIAEERTWLSGVTDDTSYYILTSPSGFALLDAYMSSYRSQLLPASSLYREGQAAMFTYSTVGTSIADGSVLDYTLSGTGISADDVVGGLSGTVTVDAGVARFALALVNDKLSEGAETLKLTISKPATLTTPASQIASSSILIADTSQANIDPLTSAVEKLYVAFFSRPADPPGLSFWVAQARANGDDIGSIVNAFSNSAEYQAIYAGLESAQIIENLYLNLFGRDAEPDGLQFWTTLYQKGILTLSSIALTLADGAQNADKIAVANKIIAANAYTSAFPSAQVSANDANLIAKAWLATVTDDASLATALAKLPSTIISALAHVGEDYRLTPDASSHNEGETAIFLLTTKGLADGTELSFAALGNNVTYSDITVGQYGRVTVNGGKASISVSLANDHLTEGNEILVLKVLTVANATEPAFNVATSFLTIVDTSTTPQLVAGEVGLIGVPVATVVLDNFG